MKKNAKTHKIVKKDATIAELARQGQEQMWIKS